VIRLDPWGPQHSPAVRALLSDPDILRYTRVPEPPPDGFEATWLARYDEGRADGTREAFAIVDGEEFLGLTMVMGIEAEARAAELGYLVAPGARGRGVATIALRLTSDWAFEARNLLRLHLLIDVTNVASSKVARSAGYTLEGVLRSLHVKGERWSDTQIWSRLRSDPAPTADA
jgi:RimJ/RimL family protein N-acetyltransferase